MDAAADPRADATNPPTTASSVVLINVDTEIYVAPRPRDLEKKAQVEPPKAVVPVPVAAPASSSKPKAKAASKKEASLRLVPARVAASWGEAVLSSDDYQVVGGERVALTAPETLAKVRSRLGESSESGPLFVATRLVRQKDENEEAEQKEPEAEGAKEEEQEEPPLEAWLVGWDEAPAGTVVLTGEVDKEWEDWGTVT